MSGSRDLIKRRAVSDFTYEAGCELMRNPGIFVGCYTATLGAVCNDCGCKPCKLLQQFEREDKAGVVMNAMNPGAVQGLKTNAELAALFGVTKRQAAKRRIQGTNELGPEV